MKETIVELNDNTRIVILDEVLTVETLEYSSVLKIQLKSLLVYSLENN